MVVAPGSKHKRRIITPLNEKRVHAWLVYDLFKTGLDTCKPISRERLTRYVWVVGGPTIPIPIEEQLTDRIPLEICSQMKSLG